jgi:hypothetical protein
MEAFTSDESRAFVGLLLLSGYSKVPYRRMYWSNDLVCNAMCRNSFEKVMAHLHFADSQLLDGKDTFYKVRILFQHLNEISKVMPLKDSLITDECIKLYYESHSPKHFMKNTSIKFGYEVWAMTSSSACLYHGKPYYSAHSDVPQSDKVFSYDVVIGLENKCDVPEGTKLYFDNYFSSFTLLDELGIQNRHV